MTWKAKAPLFHDPSQAEFQPGDVVPDAVVADSPWLVEAGLVEAAGGVALTRWPPRPGVSMGPRASPAGSTSSGFAKRMS